MKVWVVFQEISDQYGNERIVCICNSKELAISEECKIQKNRTRIKEFEVMKNKEE